jgi:hypothetical protein
MERGWGGPRTQVVEVRLGRLQRQHAGALAHHHPWDVMQGHPLVVSSQLLSDLRGSLAALSGAACRGRELVNMAQVEEGMTRNRVDLWHPIFPILYGHDRVCVCDDGEGRKADQGGRYPPPHQRYQQRYVLPRCHCDYRYYQRQRY